MFWVVALVLAWIVISLFIRVFNKSPVMYIGGGFLLTFMIMGVVIMIRVFFFPSHDELVLQASEAEKQYYLLSQGSIDHGRICDSANEALRKYQALGDSEKVNMFHYLILGDKCL